MTTRPLYGVIEEVVPANGGDERGDRDDWSREEVSMRLEAIERRIASVVDWCLQIAQDQHAHRLNNDKRFDEIVAILGAVPRPRAVIPPPAPPPEASIPPVRGRLDSVSDLGCDHITELQIRELVDGKVKAALEQQALVKDAEMTRAVKAKGAAMLGAAITAGLTALGAALWAWIKTWKH